MEYQLLNSVEIFRSELAVNRTNFSTSIKPVFDMNESMVNFNIRQMFYYVRNLAALLRARIFSSNCSRSIARALLNALDEEAERPERCPRC